MSNAKALEILRNLITVEGLFSKDEEAAIQIAIKSIETCVKMRALTGATA
jgi:hypothetical protein